MVFSVRPSVRPSHLFDYVPIIVSSWNFPELLPMTNVRSMQKVNVTEVRTQLNRFRTVTPVWIHICWWNDAQMVLRRGAIFFSMSTIKFQGHTLKKSSILTQMGRFRTVTPVWIRQWLRNDGQSLNKHRRGALLFSRSSVKFQGHSAKTIVDIDPYWLFPDCNSSLNSQMATNWYTKLEVA